MEHTRVNLGEIQKMLNQTDDGFGLAEVAKMLIAEGGWEGS